jgi:hypothetical protein
MEVTMKIFAYALLTLSMVLILPLIAAAGYHHGGYGCMGKIQSMDSLDTDGEPGLSFDEFTAPARENWESGFNMIDTDGDGTINNDEYDAFLGVHGMK